MSYIATSSYLESCTTCNPPPAECTHSYTNFYTNAHPHDTYKKCSLCDDKVYTGGTRYIEGCATCEASNTSSCTHDYTLKIASAHPHKKYQLCSLCNDVLYTGDYGTLTSCAQCSGGSSSSGTTCVHDTSGSDRYASKTVHPHSIYRKCSLCGVKVYDGSAMNYPDYCEVCAGNNSGEGANNSSQSGTTNENGSILNTVQQNGETSFTMDINDVKKASSSSSTIYRTIGMSATVNGVTVNIPIAGYLTDGSSSSESNQWSISTSDLLSQAAKQYGTNSPEYAAIAGLANNGGAVTFNAIQTTISNGTAAGNIDENGNTSGTVYTDLEGIQNASGWSNKTMNEDLPKYYDNTFVIAPTVQTEEDPDGTDGGEPATASTPTPTPTPTPPPTVVIDPPTSSTPSTPTPTPKPTPVPTPVPTYPDLTVTGISPTIVRPNTTAMTCITVKNLSTKAVTGAVVKLTVNGKTYATTVDLGANSTATVTLRWPTPASGVLPATAVINGTRIITESNYTNNSKTENITVKTTEHAKEIKNPVNILTPPAGDSNPTVTWTEDGKTYTATLSLSATLTPSQMKSGYGFTAAVTSSISTNYPDTTKLLPTQLMLMFVPEEQYKKVVYFDKVSTSSLTTTWQLEIHATSVLNSRKWFVPVWFPDGNYTVLITAYGAYTPGGELVASTKPKIVIKGNMHEDDVTSPAG